MNSWEKGIATPQLPASHQPLDQLCGATYRPFLGGISTLSAVLFTYDAGSSLKGRSVHTPVTARTFEFHK
jgi:hypothetical protein